MTDGAPPASAGPDGEPRRAPRRLRRRRDFLAAAGGKRFHTERLTAQGRLRAPGELREGAPAEGLHLGFTITKRVGHATERNRIRRRLRRAVEEAVGEAGGEGVGDPVSCAADVVVIARRPALDAPFTALVEDLRRALGVVLRPRKPKHGDAAPGVREREGAHVPRQTVPRRGKSRATRRPEPRPDAPHGSTDG